MPIRKHVIRLTIISMLFIFLVACMDVLTPEKEIAPTTTPTIVATEPLSLMASSEQVVQALASKDFETLAGLVHSERGVRFSPYAYVREEHQVFMPEELNELSDSGEVFTWGNYDGSGEPIELTFDEYFEEFVYSADFSSTAEVAVNERLGQGNSINNIEEFFPEASFVEFYIPGSNPQYAGMDWESLRLVFVQENEVWYLVGIVHDEWTI